MREQIRRGIEYLKRFPDTKFQGVSYYQYAHYYAIQAMYQMGEEEYQSWYPRIRQGLLGKQRHDGSFGNAVDTGFSVLILGVPYRFLPIYQR